MNFVNSTLQTLRILENEQGHDLQLVIDMAKRMLPNPKDFPFISFKDMLLDNAKESGYSKFRLLATFNDQISIYNWCNAQCNFIYMCQTKSSIENSDKDYTVEYSLEELPEMIDNAESYLKSIKSDYIHSGSPFMISRLQIMAIS